MSKSAESLCNVVANKSWYKSSPLNSVIWTLSSNSNTHSYSIFRYLKLYLSFVLFSREPALCLNIQHLTHDSKHMKTRVVQHVPRSNITHSTYDFLHRHRNFWHSSPIWSITRQTITIFLINTNRINFLCCHVGESSPRSVKPSLSGKYLKEVALHNSFRDRDWHKL